MATKKKVGRPPKADKPNPPSVAAAVERLEAKAPAEPKSNAERQRDFRARKKGAAEKSAPLVIVVDEGDVAVAAEIGGVLWDMIGPFARCRPLDEPQKLRLGRALAPLIKKYLPLLADWQYEGAALLCVMALARETHIPKEVSPEEDKGGDDLVAAGSPDRAG
jgi:hypothetical protein